MLFWLFSLFCYTSFHSLMNKDFMYGTNNLQQSITIELSHLPQHFIQCLSLQLWRFWPDV